MPARVTDLKAYIERRTKKTEAGCWDWQGSKDPLGYGTCRVQGIYLAHRLSHLAYKGSLTEGLMVLHSCDNPSCCNPDHLREGTALENMQDRKERTGYYTGDQKGSSNGNAKLNNETVLAIFNATGTQKEIAAKYGCSQMTVSLIKRRKLWQHVTSNV